MGEVLTAVTIVNALLTLIANAASQGKVISDLIQKAQGENRDVFTDAEWQQIISLDDVARANLEAQILAKKP